MKRMYADGARIVAGPGGLDLKMPLPLAREHLLEMVSGKAREALIKVREKDGSLVGVVVIQHELFKEMFDATYVDGPEGRMVTELRLSKLLKGMGGEIPSLCEVALVFKDAESIEHAMNGGIDELTAVFKKNRFVVRALLPENKAENFMKECGREDSPKDVRYVRAEKKG